MAYIGKSPSTGVRNRFIYTATAGQTTFSGTDDHNRTLSYTDAEFTDVFLNGVKLDKSDYTATSGTSIVLDSGATVGDTLEILGFDTFSVFSGEFSQDVTVGGSTTLTGDLTVDTNTLHVDSTNNRVGIGTASPAHELTIQTASADPTFRIHADTDSSPVPAIELMRGADDTFGADIYTDYRISNNGGNLIFERAASGVTAEVMRLDSFQNLLVGMTSGIGTFTNAGVGISSSSNYIHAIRDGNIPLFVGRKTSDGEIVRLYKDGTVVGSITSRSGLVSSIVLDPRSTGAGFTGSTRKILPADQDGNSLDNAIDLGQPATRFDDIYATNGTIQTSDQNEKQQIASLTSAEITAAKAISKLFKTFKWNDSVTANGDNARTHTGVIAQEVRSAMTDAGLDETKYAFWCSDIWWETQTEVPAVEADEENGIEAKDAYTRTDTYETAEEAPEGATERTRLGIRYPELLAFIGAATEQRLADIETRLIALEAE